MVHPHLALHGLDGSGQDAQQGGLARARTAQQTHALAGLDGEVEFTQRGLAVGVSVHQLVRGDVAAHRACGAAQGVDDGAAAGGRVAGGCAGGADAGQCVALPRRGLQIRGQLIHGLAQLGPAAQGQQDLTHRAQRSPAEHGHGDERPHGDVLAINQVRAHHQQADIAEQRHRHLPVRLQHHRQTQLARRAGQLQRRCPKALLHAAAGMAGAQGVQRRQGVGQQGQFGGLLGVDVAGLRERAVLEPLAHQHIQTHPDQHHHQKRPGDQANDQQHQHQKRHIGHGQQVLRREEIACRSEITVKREEPRRHARLRPAAGRRLQQSGKQALVDQLVHRHGHALDVAHAQGTQTQLNGQVQDHANGQGPKRFEHTVVHHLVVNQHAKQRRHKHAQVDEETGQSEPTQAAPQDKAQPGLEAGEVGGDGGITDRGGLIHIQI